MTQQNIALQVEKEEGWQPTPVRAHQTFGTSTIFNQACRL